MQDTIGPSSIINMNFKADEEHQDMLDQQVDDLSKGRTDDHAGCRIDHVTLEGEFILLVLECPLERNQGAFLLSVIACRG